MRILFIIPRVSDNYKHHVKIVAAKGWAGANFLKRDLRRNERTVQRSFYGLGLLTLVSLLQKDIEVTFVDENFQNNIKEIFENNRFDLVAVTAQLIQSQRALELIDYLITGGVYVVVGGSHPTTFPDDYLREGVSVVTGEGEELFQTFLNDFESNSPLPLYQKNGDNCLGLEHPSVPSFHLVSQNRYNLVGVQTTRGCPYRCKFCNVFNISGSEYRHKPVESVRAEVSLVKRFWPDSRFFFFDDNTFADREYAFELFDALKDIQLGQWIAHANINISQDKELLDLVSSNGKPFFSIGFETLSKKNAPFVGNKMKTSYMTGYAENIADIQQKGIMVGGSFIFGFPGDTRAELNEIMEFIERTKITAYVTRYSLIPGSRIYDETVAEYEAVNGPLNAKGISQARLINEYHMNKIGYGFHDTEDMIIDALRETHVSKLPMIALDNLATYRTFFDK